MTFYKVGFFHVLKGASPNITAKARIVPRTRMSIFMKDEGRTFW